jgi:hypothetical protein
MFTFIQQVLIASSIINVKGGSLWSQIIELRRESRNLLWEYWLTETLFTFNWWFLIITTIAFVLVWLRLLDKKRLVEVVSFGLMIGSIGYFLDITGVSFVMWSYPDKIFPIIPPIIEIHKFHLPIVYMIVYQYFPKWKPFLLVMTVCALFFSFVLEPITVWLGIYEIYHWEYIYSFPIYIIIGVFCKWIIEKLKQMDRHY